MPKAQNKSPQARGGYKGDRAQAGRAANDRHHPNATQQGLPPPQHLQHARSSVVQQHADSPHQQTSASNAGPYASPHPPHQGIPAHHQSPYVNQVQGHPGQHQPELPYFTQQQYGSNGSAGQYSSGGDIGMSASTMNRPQYPPMHSYPQSNSPGSVPSPQHDPHGRPMYGQQQMQHNIYQYPYPAMSQPSPYAPHPQQQQQQQQASQMATNPMMIKYEATQPMQSQAAHPHTPAAMPQSPRSKITPNSNVQRTPAGMPTPQQQQQQQQQQQHTPSATPQSAQMQTGTPGAQNVNPNAAPGPIPATTPLVVRQDGNGVQWIAFEYSRDRVKMEYTIRCDVESINVDDLPADFKTENCVYPRACCPKEQYKGNRLHYETECNTVGWALAQLNACLRGKRGLIQRAVDSWRNSNQDPRLRSRRVRRQAKIDTRKTANPRPGAQMAAPTGPVPAGMPAGVPAAAGMLPGGPRQPGAMGVAPQIHHHHEHPVGAPGEDVNASSTSHGASAPDTVRQAQSFYPTYPTAQNMAGGPAGGMPRLSHDGLSAVGAHAQPHSGTGARGNTQQPVSAEEAARNIALFGDLDEQKRRKFILVEDPQRGSRVRVRVMLDQVHMEEMPDSYRKASSVFPRSFFPTQMQSPPLTPRGTRYFAADAEDADSTANTLAGASAALAEIMQQQRHHDHDPSAGIAGTAPTRGRTVVPVAMMDGSSVRVPQPRMHKGLRRKEVTLNDLGYRMSWSQSRVFAERPLFLQRSHSPDENALVDAYRNKMRSAMLNDNRDLSVAPHFETRAGKRKWAERFSSSSSGSAGAGAAGGRSSVGGRAGAKGRGSGGRGGSTSGDVEMEG